MTIYSLNNFNCVNFNTIEERAEDGEYMRENFGSTKPNLVKEKKLKKFEDENGNDNILKRGSFFQSRTNIYHFVKKAYLEDGTHIGYYYKCDKGFLFYILINQISYILYKGKETVFPQNNNEYICKTIKILSSEKTKRYAIYDYQMFGKWSQAYGHNPSYFTLARLGVKDPLEKCLYKISIEEPLF